MTPSRETLSAADRLSDLQKAELSRSLKHSEFLQAVRSGAPLQNLEEIKRDIEALTELALLAMQRVLDDLRKPSHAREDMGTPGLR
jgi:hypothetical protein